MKDMTLQLRWMGTSCFELILSRDVHIMLDPYMDDSHNSPITTEEIARCDYIFLTHGHWDHVLDVGKLANRFSPKIFCNSATSGALIEHQRIAPELITEITIGDTVKEQEFIVEVLLGVHTNAAREYKRLTGKDMPKPEDFKDEKKTTGGISQEFSVSQMDDGRVILVYQLGNQVAIQFGESPTGP